MSSPIFESLPIIPPKLKRPPSPIDLIPRPQITKWLDGRRNRPLTLVSAPAGYGKTTIVGSWLEVYQYPNAWLTLDERDNDVVVFLKYLITAIRSIFPKAANNTHSLLLARNLPPIEELVINLCNDINQLREFFVLVLDEYELIHEYAVHNFLNEFLNHPPSNMNLVICTRVDPPFSLIKLRAKGQMCEIHAQDLRFSVAETYRFLKKAVGPNVDLATAQLMDEQSEGWITGLRLLAQTLRQQGDQWQSEYKLTTQNEYVVDYLMSEILANQSAEHIEALLKTSILERLNAGLVEALCLDEIALDGGEFINWLVDSNLFVMRLDDQNEWMRYHQLFRKFLASELKRRYDKNAIANLHSRAGEWFEQNGMVNQAFDHYIAAGEVAQAAYLVEQNCRTLLKNDDWRTIEKWLNKLPEEIIQQRARLLITRAWIAHYKFALSELPPILNRIEKLASDHPIDHSILGDINFFWGNYYYWQGEGERSSEYLSRALEQIPLDDQITRGNVEVFWALANQMAGRKEQAVDKIKSYLFLGSDTLAPERVANLLAALLMVYLISGELTKAYQILQQVDETVAQGLSIFAKAWIHYLKGYIYYCWNDIEKASYHFAQCVKDRYFLGRREALDGMAGLVYSYHSMQQPEKANRVLELLHDFAMQSNDPTYMDIFQSCMARFSILQEDLASAQKFLKMDESLPNFGTMFSWLEVPHVTQCWVLIAEGSSASLEKATQRLKVLGELNDAQHNDNHSMNIWLLQAMVDDKKDRPQKALDNLERAIKIAERGNWIRPFIELGAPMANLLYEYYSNQGQASHFVLEILQAFRKEIPLPLPLIQQPENDAIKENIYFPPMTEHMSPLTNRELEVLTLLAERLTNKEIAVRLVISSGTVRQHTHKIYTKLRVKGRRQAIAKAIKLGIISTKENEQI
jgi:LuxR family maltose regulon positive regulatory protein